MTYILTFGKMQIYLLFRSLNRIFAIGNYKKITDDGHYYQHPQP